MNNVNEKIIKLMQTALLAALCFVSFTYIQIKIPIPGGDYSSFHIGNAFCVLAALLLGGWYGGFAGAIGMTIADIIDPAYLIVAPKTFILKLCIGLITGFVAHSIGKISWSSDKKYIFKWSLLAAICGLGFNVIADPIVGYFYKMYVIGQPQEFAAVLAKLSAVTTFVNAVLSVVISVALYSLLKPALSKSNLILPVGRNK